MREKLDDVNRSLEEGRNSLEKHKRESSMKSEKDRLQIGELQLEVSRLKSQLDEKVAKYEGIKASLVEQLNREKEAKFEMVIIYLSTFPKYMLIFGTGLFLTIFSLHHDRKLCYTCGFIDG